MKLLQVHDKSIAIPISGQYGVAPAAASLGGGMEVYLSSIAEGLLARGHEISELRFSDAAPEPGTAPTAGRYRLRSSSVIPRRGLLSDIERIVRLNAPDVIHLHSPYYAIHPAVLARICRLRPTVLTQHDVTPICFRHTKLRRDGVPCGKALGIGCITSFCHVPGSHIGLARDCVRFAMAPLKLRALRRVPLMIVPSQYLRDQLVLNGFDPERIRVVTQFSTYNVEEPRPHANSKRILFVGRLVPEKGVEILFDALDLLRTVGWEAVIIGDGPLLETMRVRAVRFGGRVRFHSNVGRDELPEFFRWCDTVVMPSLIPESFGLVGVEAFSFSRPVVAFPSGGITEWLVDEVTGLIATHGDPGDLALCLDRVLGSLELRQRLGAAGALSVSESYNLDRHLDRLVRAYNDVAGAFSHIQFARPTAVFEGIHENSDGHAA